VSLKETATAKEKKSEIVKMERIHLQLKSFSVNPGFFLSLSLLSFIESKLKKSRPSQMKKQYL
jgi:hypothetical protein